MPNYIVVLKNGEFRIKRDRTLKTDETISSVKEDDKDIIRITAKSKDRALKQARAIVAFAQQQQLKAEQEKKGSTISQTSEVKTEQKNHIALVPESFEGK